VTSSKSVTVLGLIVGAAGPLPLQPVAGVAGPVSARAPPPVDAIVLLLVVPYQKSEIKIYLFKILFFYNSRAG